MKIKKIKKILKPIEIDAHFRYICPDTDCGFSHWLSLKQCETKNFKVVCDCGCIFRPKRISNISIKYEKKKKFKQKPVVVVEQIDQKIEATSQKNEVADVPSHLVESASGLLINYGFTEIESESLVRKAFAITQIVDSTTIVKYILENVKQLEANNGFDK